MYRLLLLLVALLLLIPLPPVRPQSPPSPSFPQGTVREYVIPAVLLLLAFLSVYPWWKLSHLQRRLLQKERQLNLCRLQLLQARLDPHFVDNVLINLQELVRRRQADKAVEHIGRLSRLLGGFMAMPAETHGSRPIDIVLEEELELLRQYLELERFQHPNSFTYAIEVHAAVRAGDEFIPPRIIQPFVENAIRHGLPQQGPPGHIRIGFLRGEGQLICTIEDSGGVSHSPMTANRPPLGRRLVDDQVALLRKMGRHVQISNHRTAAGGTIVTLTFETV